MSLKKVMILFKSIDSSTSRIVPAIVAHRFVRFSPDSRLVCVQSKQNVRLAHELHEAHAITPSTLGQR